MRASTPAMDGVSWGLIGLLALLWSGSFFFYKILVAALPPFTVVFGRVTLAALALNLILFIRRDPLPLSPKLWGQFLVLGLFNSALPFTLFCWSEVRIPSGMAAILNATTPVFSVLVASLMKTGERMTPARALAVLLGFFGVVVLVGPGVFAGGQGWGQIVSQLACLGAAASYAWVSFYSRRFSALSPLKIATAQCTAASVILAPLVLIFDHIWTLPMPTPPVWAALLGISLISTAAAYLVFFMILKRAGAGNVNLVTFVIPISALALGAVALHEIVAPSAYFGMVLIGLSLLAIDGRVGRWATQRLART
jgi:drug/metabolite transporter (DMT)-like permease